MTQKIAIIGAGMTGLTLARTLRQNHEVTVFEKARGVGGRMSTRYATVDPVSLPTEQGSARSVEFGAKTPTHYYFDHGAQFFTARSEGFRQFLEHFIKTGIVKEWQGKVITLEEGKAPTKRLWFEPHYVASPHMNSLCKKLAEGVDVVLSTELAPLAKKQSDGWYLQDTSGKALGVFDWVISTAPMAQTHNLFHTYLPTDHLLQQVTLRGCYALMIGLPTPWEYKWIAAKVQNSPLEWIAVNSSKPARNHAVTSLVVHSTHDWAEAHIDSEILDAQEILVEAFQKVTGITLSHAEYLTTHRWRYAATAHSEETMLQPFMDDGMGLAACGDWQGISRVETGWLAAQSLLKQF